MVFTLLLVTFLSYPSHPQQSGGPGQSRNDVVSPKLDDQNRNSVPQTIQQLPSWIFERPLPPTVNVYTGKHVGEESHCAHPKGWEEWGTFAWCRGVEWVDAERVIAVFTVILGFATFFLWRVTGQLVRSADRTAEAQLRAYISITPKVALNWTMASQVAPGVSFDAENHGSTVGSETLYEYGMDVFDNPSPANFVLPPLDQRYDQNDSFFPRMIVPVRLSLGRTLTLVEIADVELGTKRFHTWGTLHYRDAFKRKRTTMFSFSFGGPQFAAVVKGRRGRVELGTWYASQ
jgi:hypothetical protein